MSKRLFFLKQDGWFEAELNGKLLYASHEEMVRCAYAMMERHGYRNYMITENPGYIIASNVRATIPVHATGMIRTD